MMQSRAVTGRGGSGLLAAAVVSALAAAAAEAATGPTQEILVTARRVEESLQDVPLAVSPFTAEQIEQLNVRSIDDLALFTPGMSFNSAFGRQPGSDRPTIRGITTIQNGVANASAAAYFIDGIYLGGSPQSTELFNVERVEVIKGPQAAQFGRGTYAGAINYVTKGPSEELEGNVEAQVGQDGWFRALGSLSGPITATLGFYVAAGYDTFDGQFTNQRDGSDLGGEESTNLTGKLVWEPTETLDVTLKLGYQETDDDHFAIYLQPRTLNNCAFRGPPNTNVADFCDRTGPLAREYYRGEAVPDWDAIELFTDVHEQTGGVGNELERVLAALTINWEIAPDITITSLTGYVDDETFTSLDVSYAGYIPIPFAPTTRGLFNQRDIDEQTDFSQELRITFNNFERVRMTGGLYYYKGESKELDDQFIDPGPPPVVTRPVTAVSLVNDEIENWAIFGGVDWDVTDRLTLGLEARYAEDEITVNDVFDDGNPDNDCRAEVCNETFDSFTPRFTARYRLTDDVNVYGNISRGTKPGNFNSEVPQVDPNDPNSPLREDLRAVDEETLWNYEIGLKSTLFDGRATFNIAAYYLDIEDQQLTQVFENAAGSTNSLLANVGQSEVFGIEIDSGFSLTEFWTGGFTYAWTDSEIKERISEDQAQLAGWDGDFATLAQFGDVSGNTTPRVAEHMVSLFTRYERPFGGGDNTWFVSADWAFESSKFAQEHNLIETGDRNTVGAQAGVVVGNWQFSIWGRNIFDDDTPIDILRYIDTRFGFLAPVPGFAAGSSTPRGFALTPQRQRQVGATLSYRFGGAR